ncbi:Clavaminate synthase-like protein [Melanomma pulvis-pyrius CBS 109.77]|uniref:Clavaminate synthase-like protein n=1 Tax=Melanomma pulvis-pyrius CBS 109.77 TaxID=1314802 RepID=A0A6A6X6S2_9PLEO|nr:Clavaminate synthase-like protein [Melanomma pulvis-pyrius CBS 109.77]
MASTIPNFVPITFAGQERTRNFGYEEDHAFPLALKANENWNPTLDEAVASIKRASESDEIFQLVKSHGGAVLLRGLPIKTPDDYSRVAHAFGFQAHEEVGRPPIRTVLAPNVKTANEGPPELPIWPHNEYGWSIVNPAWLTFSCLAVPPTGGATPIISSIGLANALQKRAPVFYEKLLAQGVRYVYRYGREQVQSNTGASIFAAYGQHIESGDDEETIREKVENEVRRHSNRFEWHEDGSLSVTHIVPIIRKHTSTGQKTWFGNLTSAYGRSRHHGATEPPYRGDDDSYHPPPTYGDGTVIENEYLELALNIAEEMQVDVEWEEGDVVLLDNYAVMHSRRPWVGKRTVLAALWDQEGRIDDFPEGLKILAERDQTGATGNAP